MSYLLGSVALGPAKISGPDRKNTAKRVAVLNDGTSTIDEVLQQGSQPGREFGVSGKLTDYDDVATLQGYQDTHETVAFVDPVTGETWSVYVLECSVKRSFPTLWEYDLSLVETAAGSG